MMERSDRYSLIDHTADIGIEVRGKDFSTLLENAGEALFSVITDISSVVPAKCVEIGPISGTRENIMRKWLDDLLCFLNVDDMLLSKFKVIALPGGRFECKAWGEVVNHERHDVHTEIKGITYHEYRVSRSDDGWCARIILDV